MEDDSSDEGGGDVPEMGVYTETADDQSSELSCYCILCSYSALAKPMPALFIRKGSPVYPCVQRVGHPGVTAWLVYRLTVLFVIEICVVMYNGRCNAPPALALL